MARRILGFGAVLLLLAVLFPAGRLAAEPVGVIEGQIVNKTAGGGGSVGSVEVTLRSWVAQEEKGSTKIQADAQGKFRFANLETASDRAYMAAVEYQGVSYGTEVLIFQSGETTKSAELAIYEPTTQNDQIRVQRAHVIIDVDREAQMAMVMEVLLVGNAGDRAYVGSQEVKAGGPKETLRVGLPPGASEVQFGRGRPDQFVQTDNGFAYVGPVAPGTTEVVYSYMLGYSGDSLKLARSVSYPVDRLNVLLPEMGIAISGDRLTAQAPTVMGEQRYLHLAGQDLPANTLVTIQLSKLGAAGSQEQEIVKWVVPAVVIVGMVGALGFLVWRRQRRPTPAWSGARQPVEPEEVEEEEEEELEPEWKGQGR